jgi:hypothetical protein
MTRHLLLLISLLLCTARADFSFTDLFNMSLSDFSLCGLLNTGLADFPWDSMTFDLPQENASIPVEGKIGFVINNLHIQGPTSVTCDSDLGLSHSTLKVQNFDLKVTHAEWDWFKLSGGSHHKGTLTADVPATLTADIDILGMKVNQLAVNFKGFKLHINANGGGFLLKIAYGYASSHAGPAVQKAVNKAITDAFGECVIDPVKCTAAKSVGKTK